MASTFVLPPQQRTVGNNNIQAETITTSSTTVLETRCDTFNVAGPTSIESIVFTEGASQESPGTGKGRLWVRDDTPNVLVFTDEDGTDIPLPVASGPTLEEVLTEGNSAGMQSIINVGTLSSTTSFSETGFNSVAMTNTVDVTKGHSYGVCIGANSSLGGGTYILQGFFNDYFQSYSNMPSGGMLVNPKMAYGAPTHNILLTGATVTFINSTQFNVVAVGTGIGVGPLGSGTTGTLFSNMYEFTITPASWVAGLAFQFLSVSSQSNRGVSIGSVAPTNVKGTTSSCVHIGNHITNNAYGVLINTGSTTTGSVYGTSIGSFGSGSINGRIGHNNSNTSSNSSFHLVIGNDNIFTQTTSKTALHVGTGTNSANWNGIHFGYNTKGVVGYSTTSSRAQLAIGSGAATNAINQIAINLSAGGMGTPGSLRTSLARTVRGLGAQPLPTNCNFLNVTIGGTTLRIQLYDTA